MKSKATVSLEVLIFIAGTIVIIALLVIPWAYGQWIRLLAGQCWYNTYNTINTLKHEIKSLRVGETSYFPMSFGDCTGAVIIANRSDVPEVYSSLFKETCNQYKSYRSYILAVPGKVNEQLSEDAKGFIDKIKGKLSRFARYFTSTREMLFAKPVCKELEIDFENHERSENILYIPEEVEKTDKYNTKPIESLCFEIRKTQNTDGSVYFTMRKTDVERCEIKSDEK